MEADLSRFHQIDLRDRYRRLPDGSRALTLRMIWVRLFHLPPESALMTSLRDGRVHWTNTDVLLAEVWQATARSKKPHPRMAKDAKRIRRTQAVRPEREAKRRDAIRRERARKHRLRGGD